MGKAKGKSLHKELSNRDYHLMPAIKERGFSSVDEYENKKRAEGLSESQIKGSLKTLRDKYIDGIMPPDHRQQKI